MTKYFTADSVFPVYIAFPRFLFDMELSETAKLLYAILLDRAKLSARNSGYADDTGVFIYYTIQNISKAIDKSETTVKISLAALEKAELITRQRQGIGQPNKIYVKIPLADTCSGQKTVCQEDGKLPEIKTENYPCDRQKTVCQWDGKLSGSNNNISNNDIVKRDSNNRSAYGNYKNVFLSGNEYKSLKDNFLQCDEYIERLSGYIASTGKKYQNHEAVIRSWILRDKPKKRNYECGEEESL